MSKFKPIPSKVHKPVKHERIITATPIAYKPKLRKLSYTREAKPMPHKRLFFHRKLKAAPKAPVRYKHKSDNTLSGKFILLMMLLVALIAAFVILLKYLIR